MKDCLTGVRLTCGIVDYWYHRSKAAQFDLVH